MPGPTIPESFKVLMKEMQSLCLKPEALDIAGRVIDIDKSDDETWKFFEH
jgi:DNA-directed RNA polymerase subunit beta